MSETLPEGEENILWSGSVSHWHYAGKWFVIVVLLAAMVASFFFPLGDNPNGLWIARGVLTVVAAVMLCWIYLDRRSHKYLVTTKRVSVEYGIISKNSTELRIQDIRSINLTLNGVAGLLGIGRVEFSSAAKDDADVIFWNTPRAEKLRDMVRGLQA